MKIKVVGKAHLQGTSKKTGNPNDFIQVHYLGLAPSVLGDAALALNLDPNMHPYKKITIPNKKAPLSCCIKPVLSARPKPRFAVRCSALIVPLTKAVLTRLLVLLMKPEANISLQIPRTSFLMMMLLFGKMPLSHAVSSSII